MVQAQFGPFDIAVLAGGDSAERNVSLQSGSAVSQALRQRGHHVMLMDPAETDLNNVSWDAIDAVFIALHGTFGEDGRVQEILEHAEVPFTGSDSTTSRLAFSKSASKERFFQQNVPTPPYILIHETDGQATIEKHAQRIGYPLVVKPDCQGSSLGVSLVSRPEELSKALKSCFRFDPFGILEAAVLGAEWTLGLIDELTLPLIQIETTRSFFDYEAKYQDDATVYRFDFDLDRCILDAITDAGRSACDALGTRGLVRVDLRVDQQLHPWVLEVNTVPGLTDHSLIPKAARRQGISLGALCELCLARCLRLSAVRPQSS